MPLPLLALAIAAFGIGTTEFVIMGLLPDVARDLAVTAPQAGMLVSAYALGVTAGAPVLAAVTARWPRRQALLGLIALFTVGNAMCALAPGYATLLVARVVTAFCHAAFFGIGAIVASAIVPRDKRAQAVALMFTGLTLANVLGVPFGTMLGHACGWRTTFWAVVLIGLAALCTLHRLLPRDLPQPGGDILRQFRTLAGAQVQLALLISTLSSVSLFAVFTYIAYILREITGFTPQGESLALLVFGLGITIGGLIGGRLADWKLMPALIGLLIGVALVLALFAWTSRFEIAALVTLFVWGVFAFAIGPSAQLRVIDAAKGAPGLASTMNQGAFNLGNATGAWLGGLVIGAGLPLTDLPWVGAAVALLGVGVVVLAMWLERRGIAALPAPDAR
ncbi:MFS transporter [Solimonas soli]|uniref:MFS transporter n=1 Tax=Solimonas soli TaxID=413479 RepID=UPI000480A308|nr:MFS transporter [Solimonas soli]